MPAGVGVGKNNAHSRLLQPAARLQDERPGSDLCRSLALARVAFAAAIAEEPAGRFMIRSRTRVVKWHPEGDW
jgi:hypothetical protein